MKIGLDTAPVTLRGNYFQHLAGVLENYAPEHEYVVDAKRMGTSTCTTASDPRCRSPYSWGAFRR